MDVQIRRYIDALVQLIERSGMAKREIEGRVGWSSGSLTKLLKGQREIKLAQLLPLLDALGVAHLVFYRLVYEEQPVTDRLLRELGSAQPAPILLPPAMSEEELDRRVEEAVERALRLRAGSSAPKD